MSLQTHLAQLEKRHRALEREIETVLNRPGTDDAVIAELKRRKLHLKDVITRIRQEAAARIVH